MASEVRRPLDGTGFITTRLSTTKLRLVQAESSLGRDGRTTGLGPEGEQEPGWWDQGSSGSAWGRRKINPWAGQTEEETSGMQGWDSPISLFIVYLLVEFSLKKFLTITKKEDLIFSSSLMIDFLMGVLIYLVNFQKCVNGNIDPRLLDYCEFYHDSI